MRQCHCGDPGRWCSVHHHQVHVPRTPPLPLLAHRPANRPECDAPAAALRAVCVNSSSNSSQDGGALPLYGQLMGAAVVSAIPVVILYMVFQRYLIGGLTAGGVKG